MEETEQIESLLALKTRLSRDERDLRGLADQANNLRAGRQDRNGERRGSRGSHWSPGQGRGQNLSKSRSRSPTKAVPSVNSIPMPETARKYTNGLPGNYPPPTIPAVLPPAPTEPELPVQPILPPGQTYERLNCVGEGTYGKVYKARNVETGVLVALKRIRMEGEKDGFPVTAMREIKLLQGLRHPNVVRLIEMMVSKGAFVLIIHVMQQTSAVLLKFKNVGHSADISGSVYMVFEYMDHDLTGLLSHPSVAFSPANLKSLNHQMLCGLANLHQRGILHRDMKGSNILITAKGELKLGDFGLARVYAKHRVQDYTNRVITLWYRSPELLLGETAYGPEVDMWSAG